MSLAPYANRGDAYIGCAAYCHAQISDDEPTPDSLLPWRSDSPVPMSSSLTSKPNCTSEQMPHQKLSTAARRPISGFIRILEVRFWWYRRKLSGLQPQEIPWASSSRISWELPINGEPLDYNPDFESTLQQKCSQIHRTPWNLGIPELST